MQTVYKNEEDRQRAAMLSSIIWVSWGAYLYVIIIGIYYGNRVLIAVMVVCSILQGVPFWLLRRGYWITSSIVTIVSVLGTVTLLATMGEGIRDISVLIFPIILIFAGLTLNRIIFGICIALTLTATGWLIFGAANGWFVPVLYGTPWMDFLSVTVVLLVSAFAIDLMAMSMRKNLKLARQEIMQRKQAEEQLRYQSMHDTLTGIYNRGFFEEELARLEHSREFPVSIIMTDVDQLKVVNDTQGHAKGDELLQHAADILRVVFRESDVLARIGGDEFAILLPNTNATTGEQILVRVKEQQAKHNIEHPDFVVQLSLGTATAEKNNLTEACTLADQRMYADKTAHKSNGN